MLVPLLALLAAALLGGSAVLTHRGAAFAPPSRHGLALLRVLARQRIWVVGAVLGVLGVGAQATALATGPLTLVEPLLTTSLLFGLPVSALTLGGRFGVREWGGTLAVVVGIAVFLDVGTPHGGRAYTTVPRWAVAGVVVWLAAVTMVGLGHRYRVLGRAAGLAAAGGMLSGLVDALMRTVGATAGHTGLGVLETWPPYVLVLTGVVALSLQQHAFREGHLAESLPAAASAEPLVGSLLGIAVLGERVHLTPLGGVLLALAGALVLGGIIVLGRSPLVTLSPLESSLAR